MAFFSTAAQTLYTVREGETLFSVAHHAQVPIGVLATYNGIDSETKLKVGSIIRFPSTYVVKRGDTLFGIARTAGVPLAKLLDLNGIHDHTKIKVGEKLFVPADKDGAASTQTTDTTFLRPAAQDGAARVPAPVDGMAQTPASRPLVWPHAGRHEPLRGKISGLVFFGVEGDAVHSATGGEVKWVGPYWGWGKTVIIKAPDGNIILYAGNEQLLVNVGDRVSPGADIARLGVSPQGGGAKLYFSIQGANGQFIDPEKYFSDKNHV